MSELREECGVIALYHLPTDKPSPLCPSQGIEEVSRLAPRMLLDLQNRGQLSAGITTYNPNRQQLLKTFKDLGTVAEVFHQGSRTSYARIMDDLAGRAAIGHVRYATCGRDDRNFAHPFERPHINRVKWFSFAFNGQLANYESLRDELLTDSTRCFARDSDSEIFMHYLCAALKNSERDLTTVCRETTRRLDGAYSLVYLNARGEMFVARDPHGFKPLCYAFDGALFAAASESVALFNLGFRSKDIKDVPPGCVAIVSPENGVQIREFIPSSRTTHCFFEWIYFANVASVLDGRSVYLTRNKLGEELAKRETTPIEPGNAIVVPVPDTSKAAANGMAFALHIPCREGLIRNRYSGRTFIEGGETRRRKAEIKYVPLPEVLEGKQVFLVEDSIVRSTTMRVLIERLRTIGLVKSIHVRVACPPIVAPCFYGIDMSTYGELFATSFMMKHYGMEGVASSDDLTTRWVLTPEIEAEMARELGCDSLRYLPPRAISEAIGISSMNLCQACVDHEYPTEAGCLCSDVARERFLRGISGRSYE